MAPVAACRAARRASRSLVEATGEARSAAIEALASELARCARELLDAAAQDVAAAGGGVDGSYRGMLELTQPRIDATCEKLREIAALPDPIGRVIESAPSPEAVRAIRIRVPLGVVALVLEGRPHLAITGAALCMKSGNATVMRWGEHGRRCAGVILAAARRALASAGLDADGCVAVDDPSEAALRVLTRQADSLDLIKQRGHDPAASAILARGTVPAIPAIDGNCHLYVDASAPPLRAVELAAASKVDRPGMCNAVETLLVHAEVAETAVPRLLTALHEHGIETRLDRRALALAPRSRLVRPATRADWSTEFMGPVLAVAVVDSIEAAIDHINRFGSGHSEGIVTASTRAAKLFRERVEAAYICVNVPTRAGDGEALGRPLQLGNSTRKLPARGPVGIEELCTSKVVVSGDGPGSPAGGVAWAGLSASQI